MLTLTLAAVNLPAEVIATGVAIVFAINPVLDMMRTATNVAGQITVPILVSRGSGILDEEALHAPTDVPLVDDEAEESEGHGTRQRIAVSHAVGAVAPVDRALASCCQRTVSWRSGRVVRQRPAKPCTRVRIPSSSLQSLDLLHGGDFTPERHAVAYRFGGVERRPQRGAEQQ